MRRGKLRPVRFFVADLIALTRISFTTFWKSESTPNSVWHSFSHMPTSIPFALAFFMSTCLGAKARFSAKQGRSRLQIAAN